MLHLQYETNNSSANRYACQSGAFDPLFLPTLGSRRVIGVTRASGAKVLTHGPVRRLLSTIPYHRSHGLFPILLETDLERYDSHLVSIRRVHGLSRRTNEDLETGFHVKSLQNWRAEDARQ